MTKMNGVDFILKPNNNKMNEFIIEIIEKIKIIASSKVLIENQIDNKDWNIKEDLLSMLKYIYR